MLQINGMYSIWRRGKCVACLPNIVTVEGAQAILDMAFRADALIASGGNFYIGLCDYVPSKANTLVSVSNEPTNAGGYARLPVTRDDTGWPTLDTINGIPRILSAQVSFTASAANYSNPIRRAFLTDAASGTSGVLFSVSEPLATSLLIEDGDTYNVEYEIFLRV